MGTPSIVHPEHITIDGYIFEILAPFEVTTEQATKIARRIYDNRKFSEPKMFQKKDRGNTIYRAEWDSLREGLESL